MDLTAITLTELRYVVAVADAGHFGRTAERCHVSQSTLSVGLKKLEETLLVAAGLGCTLSPVVARPFRAPAPHRRIGLVWRRSFSDEGSLNALAALVRTHVPRAARAVRNTGIVV